MIHSSCLQSLYWIFVSPKSFDPPVKTCPSTSNNIWSAGLAHGHPVQVCFWWTLLCHVFICQWARRIQMILSPYLLFNRNSRSNAERAQRQLREAHRLRTLSPAGFYRFQVLTRCPHLDSETCLKLMYNALTSVASSCIESLPSDCRRHRSVSSLLGNWPLNRR